MTISVVPPPDPTPAEAAALATKPAAYALDLCELVIPGHSAVMLFRDVVHVFTDGEEDLHACRDALPSPRGGDRPESD
ncbi:MAG: hypothetical protein ACRDZO_24275 [Egibacteraceae bacterium]